MTLVLKKLNLKPTSCYIKARMRPHHPQNCPYPWRIGPSSNAWFFRPSPSLHHKWHPDQFSRLCKARGSEQQTHRHTDRATSVAISLKQTRNSKSKDTLTKSHLRKLNPGLVAMYNIWCGNGTCPFKTWELAQGSTYQACICLNINNLLCIISLLMT